MNWSSIQRFLRRFGPAELVLYLPVFLLVGCVWVFMELAEEVMEGDTKRFDSWMIRSMRLANDPSIPVGPPWLREAGRDLTALGGSTVLALMIFVVAGYLFLQKKYHAMWVTLICTTSGLVASLVLKRIFSRPRPTEVPHLSETMTSSFPSGHSMLSAVVYLTLGMLLTRVVAGRASKIYFLGIAMVITFLVGVSRVYLGVHYPTDVMAGWMAGFVWALLCWMITRYLQHRGQVEPPSHEQT